MTPMMETETPKRADEHASQDGDHAVMATHARAKRSRIGHPQNGALAVACVTLTLVSLSGLDPVHSQTDELRLREDIV
ncbi:MAG: hypothetical protein OSB03_19485, partial [Vicinamibacterales bacterium]|nr:hypothetical protein [Vicinamibacterales bacterium]